MSPIPRRAALAGAGLSLALAPATARALEPTEALTLLGQKDAEDFVKRAPGFITVARWGELWAACLAIEDHTVKAAVIEVTEDGTKRIVAGPTEAEILSIDPFWTLDLAISPLFPLGLDIPAFGVTVTNSYVSTARASASKSMSIFLRDGDKLRQVFRGFFEASSSEQVDCRRPSKDGQPCRESWSDSFVIKTAGPAVGGKPPALIVVNRATKRIVSRHVWHGDRYQPDTFDKM